MAGSSSNSTATLPLLTLFGALIVTNIFTLLGFATHPNLRSLLSNETVATFPLYEARVSQLRADVDRLRSREMVNRGNEGLRLQDLLQRQAQVGEQFAVVDTLSTKAAALGLQLLENGVSEAASIDPPVISSLRDFDSFESQLLEMERNSELAVASLAQVATRSADLILAELERLGGGAKGSFASGGPLLPAIDISNANSPPDGSDALAALERLRAAKEAMDAVPVHKPLENVAVSSEYGTRQDPFTGQTAFHAGIDLPAPMGTTVVSAADGVVSFVGWRDGYGNVVEITHASGLMSRYPHLSKVLVAEGDVVVVETPIARVGTSGRSTGPHLHFELRFNDQPIDPAPYMATGQRLEQFHT